MTPYRHVIQLDTVLSIISSVNSIPQYRVIDISSIMILPFLTSKHKGNKGFLPGLFTHSLKLEVIKGKHTGQILVVLYPQRHQSF